ncbi:MAG TPA: hypothetical protein VLT36_13030 [Candidatus Dormibacteraeota bacterium]|nr:hypothetical protein [Candidatus Dormibacteraeota bacterium]
MQTKDSNNGTPGALIHPEAAEWMALLYEEIAPERKKELSAHLEHCPACASRVNEWQASREALNQWTLPARRPARAQSFPSLKWAAAAAILLVLGFVAGRQTSRDRTELAALKQSVGELNQIVQRQNSTVTEYYAVQQEEDQAHRQAVNAALSSFDGRIDKLREELETVALNAETGFRQTRADLTRVVTLSTAPVSQPQ